MKTKKLAEQISLEEVNVEKLAEDIRKVASEARNEEELKIGIVNLFDPIIRKWNIPSPRYEHRTIISGARKDALYGHVIIEFKTPGRLDIKNEFEKAKVQVKKYINEEGVDPTYFNRWLGVLTDGNKISFIRYRKNEWEEQEEPLLINSQTVLRLLEAIRGLRRKPIDAKELLNDFGPKSEISDKVISALYDSLIDKNAPKTDMLFNDWKRVFSQVCSYSPEKLQGLIDYYRFKKHKKVDVEKLLFAIHTYYTILMKLLTSEIVTLFADSLLGSYLKTLEEAYYKGHKEMREELEDLEEGGIFATVGIRNFLEADYFAWYLNEWNESIATSFFELTTKLLDYEPATVELNPERVKDLFKRLYQNLVPRDIRHKLGEYFTPDWLAELLLDEAGYDGDPDKRVLDPACGSGTFLVLAIKRIREHSQEHFIDERTLVKRIIENVHGIDLNPLAVLASKANYLIALSDLIRYRPKDGIEIPIYLADSISIERGRKWETLTKEHEDIRLYTSEGEFWIPTDIIEKELLAKILYFIDQFVKAKYSRQDFEKTLIELLKKDKIYLAGSVVSSLGRLFDKIRKLDRDGKNKIWTSLLKNSFAPLLIGKFDFIIGNPPWINWESLPEFYRNREEVRDLWNRYGLLEKTKGMGLGKVKRDISMLFVARCFSVYLNSGGKLAFLIPFTTYKTQAGAGFRNWLANKCEVVKIHDLVTLYPFEGATNRTSLIVIKEGQTKFPIPCVMWHNLSYKGIEMETGLEEVQKIAKQFDMILAPLKIGKPETPWMIISKKLYLPLQRLMKSSEYNAHAGVCTWADGIYWIEILTKQSGGILISNVGRTAKMLTKRVTKLVDSRFIFPVLRGKNHKKWYTKSEGYILLPVSLDGVIISERDLRVNYPNTYSFFLSFFKELKNRSGYKQLLEKVKKPFYSVLRSEYGVMPYKVAWKHISGKISGKALFECSVIEEEGNKPVIPTHGLIIIPCKNRDEAYYVCAILNSSFASLIVTSYALEVHVPTDIPQNVFMPNFNLNNPLHFRLSSLSQKAHELARRYHEQNDLIAQSELRKIEEEIDEIVAELYGITDEELEEIKKTLRILKEGEAEEEEIEDEEIVMPKVKEIEVKVEPLFIKENEEKKVECTISNNSDKSLTNIKIKISLDSKSIVSEGIRKIDKESSQTIAFISPKLKSGEHDLTILLGIGNEEIEEKRKLFVGAEKKAKKLKSALDDEIEKKLR